MNVSTKDHSAKNVLTTYISTHSLLYIFLISFVFVSITDLITTYVGLTAGFAEQTDFVRLLWNQYGFMGLVLSKVISVVCITVIPAPLYIINKKLSKQFLIVLYVMGTLYMGYASVHNLMIMNYI